VDVVDTQYFSVLTIVMSALNINPAVLPGLSSVTIPSDICFIIQSLSDVSVPRRYPSSGTTRFATLMEKVMLLFLSLVDCPRRLNVAACGLTECFPNVTVIFPSRMVAPASTGKLKSIRVGSVSSLRHVPASDVISFVVILSS